MKERNSLSFFLNVPLVVFAVMLWWNNTHYAINYFSRSPSPPPVAMEFQQTAREVSLPLATSSATFATPMAPIASETTLVTSSTENSYQRAVSSGFMRAVNYVCALKQTSCSRLLAIAKLESGVGQQTVNRNSSARGTMQVLSGTFLEMVERYGANNLGNLAGYIDSFGPNSPEAAQLRGDFRTLQTAVAYMQANAHKNRGLPPGLQRAVLRLNERPIIQLLLVADSLADQDSRLMARGLSYRDSFIFSYFGYFAGVATFDAVLPAYADPVRRNQPVEPILVGLYDGIAAKKRMAPAQAHREAVHLAGKVLRDNGQNGLTTVKGFVEARVTPFMQLTGQYDQLGLMQPTQPYAQTNSSLLVASR